MLAKHLTQGLEQAEQRLSNEARGLKMVDARSESGRGVRVSRLLLLSDDGAERFYRQAERLLLTHGERLLAIRLSVPADKLGEVLHAPGVVRALLIEHKQSVADTLVALAGKPPG
jgi:hypothetical protein